MARFQRQTVPWCSLSSANAGGHCAPGGAGAGSLSKGSNGSCSRTLSLNNSDRLVVRQRPGSAVDEEHIQLGAHCGWPFAEPRPLKQVPER
jgi:hypothetical protein